MFSLIISIIAIALVAALALASIYYGGSAFNEGTSKADAATLINQGQQIQAAVTMANIERDTVVSTLSGLTTDYLQSVPEFDGKTWGEPDANGISTSVATIKTDVCTIVNERAGIDTAETDGSETKLFGCNSSGEVYYKVGTFYTAS